MRMHIEWQQVSKIERFSIHIPGEFLQNATCQWKKYSIFPVWKVCFKLSLNNRRAAFVWLDKVTIMEPCTTTSWHDNFLLYGDAKVNSGSRESANRALSSPQNVLWRTDSYWRAVVWFVDRNTYTRVNFVMTSIENKHIVGDPITTSVVWQCMYYVVSIVSQTHEDVLVIALTICSLPTNLSPSTQVFIWQSFCQLLNTLAQKDYNGRYVVSFTASQIPLGDAKFLQKTSCWTWIQSEPRGQ